MEFAVGIYVISIIGVILSIRYDDEFLFKGQGDTNYCILSCN